MLTKTNPRGVVLAALASFVMMLLLVFLSFWRFREQVWTGANDFLSFYAGGRLAGTPDLYSADRNAEVQSEHAGATGTAFRFIRLPYYAGLLWPLAKLPYRAAYLVWEILGVSAFVLFIFLWRPPALLLTLLFSCYSLPVITGLLNGQDVVFLLLWLALGAYLYRTNRLFAAGAALSLCAAKFHIFILLPVLIVASKERRIGLGFLTGGAVLLAASFAVGGWDWPAKYSAMVFDPNIHPAGHTMPNLHGLFRRFPAGAVLEWVVALTVVTALWRVARRASFLNALAAAVAGGLLISYHAYLADCALLLPVALTVFATTTLAWLRAVAVFLLIPLGYLLLLLDSSFAALVPLATLALVYGMAYEAGLPRTAEDTARRAKKATRNT